MHRLPSAGAFACRRSIAFRIRCHVSTVRRVHDGAAVVAHQIIGPLMAVSACDALTVAIQVERDENDWYNPRQ
jgi:hypothetical protein